YCSSNAQIKAARIKDAQDQGRPRHFRNITPQQPLFFQKCIHLGGKQVLRIQTYGLIGVCHGKSSLKTTSCRHRPENSRFCPAPIPLSLPSCPSHLSCYSLPSCSCPPSFWPGLHPFRPWIYRGHEM